MSFLRKLVAIFIDDDWLQIRIVEARRVFSCAFASLVDAKAASMHFDIVSKTRVEEKRVGIWLEPPEWVEGLLPRWVSGTFCGKGLSTFELHLYWHWGLVASVFFQKMFFISLTVYCSCTIISCNSILERSSLENADDTGLIVELSVAFFLNWHSIWIRHITGRGIGQMKKL